MPKLKSFPVTTLLPTITSCGWIGRSPEARPLKLRKSNFVELLFADLKEFSRLL
jgi:hypothetical protein